MMFSQNLNSHMDRMNVSPTKLAALMEEKGDIVSPATVQRWLDGLSKPDADRATTVAGALGLTPNDLLLPMPEPCEAIR